MKKMNQYLLMSALFGVLSFQSEGFAANSANNDAKYEILKRDQVDDTDTYAIPFDDSEVEDEEEVNAIEKKEVFKLPKA